MDGRQVCVRQGDKDKDEDHSPGMVFWHPKGTKMVNALKDYIRGKIDRRGADHAEIIREKGTNRVQFHRGEVDKYTWIELGSSYLPSELNAAYLYAELENAQKIYDNRMASWNAYRERLQPLADAGDLQLPYIPAECNHNAHMFYLKVADLKTRTAWRQSGRARSVRRCSA